MAVSTLLRPQRFLVRAPRIDFQLAVETKTIGAHLTYVLNTMDVSKSGLLLEWEGSLDRIPYLERTIIEMRIDPRGDWLQHPVTAMGKVVRRDCEADGAEQRVKIGVQLILMDADSSACWETFVDRMEFAERQGEKVDEFLRSEGPSRRRFEDPDDQAG